MRASLEAALATTLEIEGPARAGHPTLRLWVMLVGLAVAVALYSKVLWWLFVV